MTLSQRGPVRQEEGGSDLGASASRNRASRNGGCAHPVKTHVYLLTHKVAFRLLAERCVPVLPLLAQRLF